MMMNTSIFSSVKPIADPDISYKLTYTEAVLAIPPNKQTQPIVNWECKYHTEWRWRFIKFFDGQEDRHIMEISYMEKGKDRVYLNKYGQYIDHVQIDPIYDSHVTGSYYLYTTK